MATSNIRRATAVNPKIIVAQTIGTTSTNPIYTCPADTSVKVTTATVCNTNLNSVRGAYISLVINGDAIPYRIANIDLQPLGSAVVAELVDVCLGPGDKIGAAATNTTDVQIVLTGVVSS